MTILLDGGMGQELRSRGLTGDWLWSAHSLMAAPAAVRDLHQEFIAAGAEIVTASNYAATPQRLAQAGIAHRFGEIVGRAVELAREARDRAGKKGVRVAGSLPPLLASYEPNAQNPARMEREYAEIADALGAVDLFICETMSSAAEARAAARAGAMRAKPVWIAWTLRDEGDGRLRSGESVAEAVAAVAGIPGVEAMLFNCCTPEAIGAALPDLRAHAGRAIGAYANAFLPIDKDWTRKDGKFRDLRPDMTAQAFAGSARPWLAGGLDIVGGCCGAGPAHIAALRALLDGA